MTSTPQSLLSFVRTIVGAWRDDPREDAELLARFVEHHDEEAFRALVWRHGQLVWRACVRVVGDGPDAEDAFQATFLALARNAGKPRGNTLAGWLHRVARQTALKVDIGARRRRSLEERLRAVAQPAMAVDVDRAALYAALDEELMGLPERLRLPLLLHYLEGRSQVEVARLLGCARSILQKRLMQGEAILRERLERRGLVVGVGSVAVLLGGTAGAPAVPAHLMGSAARAALRSLSFPFLESSTSAALTEGVMETMWVTKVKIVAVLLGLTLCLAGGGLLAYQALAGNAAEPPQAAGEPRGEAKAPRQPGAAARVDCFGDLLPAHALARMGTTRLWHGGDGIVPCTGGSSGRSLALAFSPDGKTLATWVAKTDLSEKGNTDERIIVCLWNEATGKEIRRLTTKAVRGPVKSLAFSPDGKMVVAVNWAKTVCWWEVATGKFLRKQEYQGSKRNLFHGAAFLPDGKILGSGLIPKKSDEEGCEVYVWDMATGKEVCQLSNPIKKRGLFFIAFSPDGKLLATTNDEWLQKNAKNEIITQTIISLWDVATGKEIRQLTHEGQACLVDTVAFSTDGKMLASGIGNMICVWELATGKEIHKLKAGVSPGLLTYSPDSKALLGRSEKAIHLWDVGTGKQIRSFGCKDALVALLSPDGKTLAVGEATGSIRLWEVATGKEIGPRKGLRGSIQSIAYSPDGKTLTSLGEDEAIRLWEVATGKEIRQLAKGSSWSVAYSRDGKLLVSTASGVLHLWDTATGEEIRQFGAGDGWSPTCTPTSATFSPDGKKLAASMRNGQTIHLLVWEVATGKTIYSLPTGKKGSVFGSVAFSPDGRLLATDDKDNTVSLWDMASGTRTGQLCGLTKPAQPEEEFFVWFLAFSPDGRMLATSSWGDDKVCLWEVATRTEICQLDVYNQRKEGKRKDTKWCGYSLAFSPDGRMLATVAHGDRGASDREVCLWEVASGKGVGRLAGHQAPIRALAFSPGGKTLASGSEDLTCLIWDVTSFEGQLKLVPEGPLAPRALSKERLETAWAELAKDPAKAYAAIRALRVVPMQAIPLLRARVCPVAPVADPQQLKRWIVDLDADSFTLRDKAQREIEKLGESAIPVLRQALQDRPSVEVRRRLKDLLAGLGPQVVVVSPQRMRELRAVQVLESIGTAEARQVLQAWAQGVSEACLTQEAQAALARLAKRSAAKP